MSEPDPPAPTDPPRPDRQGPAAGARGAWRIAGARTVVALLVAVLATAGVIAALWSFGLIGEAEPDKDQARVLPSPDAAPGSAGETQETVIARPRAQSSLECIEFSALTPDVVPHYLINSVGSVNFPYWLSIEGQNRCDRRWQLEVDLEPQANVTLDAQSVRFAAEPEAGFVQTITPDFDLPKQFVEEIAIGWTVTDAETGKRLGGGDISTRILPPHTVAWNFTRAGGEPADPGFVLASLAAWTRPRLGPVPEFGRACRGEGGEAPALGGEAAIEACYRALFGDGAEGGPVRVTAETAPFAAGETQTIPPPEAVLADRQAGALDAALLLIAVLEAQRGPADPALVLVAATPEDAAPAEGRRIMVAWREDGDWQGLDMGRAGALGFDDNRAATTPVVRAALAADPALGQALETTGAGFGADRGVAVADLGRAGRHYGIQGLP